MQEHLYLDSDELQAFMHDEWPLLSERAGRDDLDERFLDEFVQKKKGTYVQGMALKLKTYLVKSAYVSRIYP